MYMKTNYSLLTDMLTIKRMSCFDEERILEKK